MTDYSVRERQTRQDKQGRGGYSVCEPALKIDVRIQIARNRLRRQPRRKRQANQVRYDDATPPEKHGPQD